MLEKQSKKIPGRALAIIVIFFALWMVIVFRLFSLQVLNNDKYEANVIGNVERETDVTANRGIIYDSNMVPLATNQTTWRIFISPRDIEDDTQAALIASQLSDILDVDYGEILGKTEKITKVYIEANETTSAGISAPEGVEILVSADKAAWTSAGNATVALKSEGIYDITLTLDSVEARYVKVVFDHKSNWVFISEVDIYASGAASEGGSTTPPASDKVVNNLISKDLTWTATDVDFGGSVGKCTYSYDGDKLTVASDVNWPNITASFDEGIVVGADDEIAVDFTLTSGYVNFYVIVDVNGEDYALYIQHSIAPDSISASSGDLSVQGEYKTSFKVKDGVGSKSGVGAVPANCATIPAADSYTIKAITIMPCGGNASLTFNAFTVTSDAPAADEPTNPSTGDAAMVFALIALVAMAGAVVVAKKVR